MSPQSRQKHIAKFWSAEIEDTKNLEVLGDRILGETLPESTDGRLATLCHDEYLSQENREAKMQDTIAVYMPLPALICLQYLQWC